MKNNRKILKEMKKRGLRNTKLRKSMLSVFEENKRPLSPQDLIKEIPFVNKTTIYRQLKTLQRQKVLKRIEFKDGITRFELKNMEHHHHLICKICKNITDVKLKNDLKLENQIIGKRQDYFITDHMLEFFGICPDCQN